MDGEVTTANNVIYGSYGERAKSAEDKDELNEVLEEVSPYMETSMKKSSQTNT